MFTLYGNQYESREEHLLLTMFQVRSFLSSTLTPANLFLWETVGTISAIRNRNRIWIVTES